MDLAKSGQGVPCPAGQAFIKGEEQRFLDIYYFPACESPLRCRATLCTVVGYWDPKLKQSTEIHCAVVTGT